jgi:hypothetical protein
LRVEIHNLVFFGQICIEKQAGVCALFQNARLTPHPQFGVESSAHETETDSASEARIRHDRHKSKNGYATKGQV